MAGVTITATPEKPRRGLSGLLGGLGGSGFVAGCYNSAACGAENVDETMVASQYQTMQWRKSKVSACHAELRRAIQDLHRERSAVGDLQDTLGATEELATEASALHASSARAAEMIRASAEAASARAAVASEGLQRLCQEKQSRLEDLEIAYQTLSEEQSSCKARLAEMEGFFALYEKNLGLRITRSAPSVVKVAFTLLDELVPDRECCFTLGLTDPSTYGISGVSPPLPQRLVSTLAERLNAAPADPSALPSFCCGMRRAFKRSLSKTAAHGGA